MAALGQVIFLVLALTAMCVCVSAHVYVCLWVYVCVFVGIYICVCICLYVCACVYILYVCIGGGCFCVRGVVRPVVLLSTELLVGYNVDTLFYLSSLSNVDSAVSMCSLQQEERVGPTKLIACLLSQ